MGKDELKGLILSGGKGSRLRPFTYTGAKQLVPVANKPVLFYAIEDLVACGIRDIGIVVGDTREQVEAAVGDGGRFGARVEFITQEEPLGIAHGVKIAADFLAGRPFVLYLGDNLVLGGVGSYVRRFRDDASHCQLLVRRVENPQSFGVAELVDGRVARVVEKPRQPATDLAVVGVYMFDAHVFEAVEQLRPSARGELEIADTIQYLIDKGLTVRAQVLDRYWMDTGKMDDILEANVVMLDALPPRCEGGIDAASRVSSVRCIRADTEDVARVVRTETHARGVSFVFDTVGIPETQRQARALLGPGGTIVSLALTDHELSFTLRDIGAERHMTTSVNYFPREFSRAVRALSVGSVKVVPYLTHRMVLSAFPRIIERLRVRKRHNALKAVIFPDQT